MLNTQHSPIVEALGEAMETMAFISTMSIDPPDAGPTDALLCAIEFSGPAQGAVEMVVSEQFARLLCGNILACAPADPEAIRCASDAVKELLNVTCGAYLTKLATSAAEKFTVTLPTLGSFNCAAQWARFVNSPGAATFDADGHTIAIRIRES